LDIFDQIDLNFVFVVRYETNNLNTKTMNKYKIYILFFVENNYINLSLVNRFINLNNRLKTTKKFDELKKNNH